MKKIQIDLVGRVVNKLRVLRRVDNVGKQPAWLCVCECGTEKRFLGMRLRSADAIDCGCGASQRRSEVQRSHGMTNTPEFRTWTGARARCTNPNNPNYFRYGGRGITFCKEWLVFENFYRDMGPRPAGTSLDRIDNDRGYSPDNCRWATGEQQCNNRRSSIFVTFDGETRTLVQWARHFKVPYPIVKDRRSNGVEGAALFAPLVRRKYGETYTHLGKSLTITGWARELNAPYITVWQRIHLVNKNPDGSIKESSC